mgnify:CR=1 FL=1
MTFGPARVGRVGGSWRCRDRQVARASVEQQTELEEDYENLQAQQARATLSRIPRRDPKYRPMDNARKKLEAELARTNRALVRVEFLRELREAMEDGAAIHFRLYFLAGDCEVDLLKSR